MIMLAALCFATMAKAQVAEFNPSVTTDGISYVLPKTALRADVSAVKTVFTPGEYAKYAERYLHFSNVRTEAETLWKVTDVNISEEGVVDTLKRFSVKSKDKNLLPKVQLSKEGFIMAINRYADAPAAQAKAKQPTHHKIDFRKYMTEEMLEATSSSKLAELVAREILDIRESKNAIRRGQADNMPKDGAGVRIVLEELNAQEEALTQLFVGYTDTIYASASFTVVPENDIDKQVFFRFSKKLGFVDDDDLAGEPFYVSVKNAHTVPLPTEKEAAKRKIVGLVYNVPGLADVNVFTVGKSYFSKRVPFAQFGTIDMLSPTLFDKNVSTKVLFDTATGAVSKIE